MNISDLREFATPRQLEYIEAVEKYGSQQKAAKAIGVDRRVIDRSINALKKKATMRGHSPNHDMSHVVPDGYVVKGVSSYYNKDGALAGQWVKSTQDIDRMQQIIKDAVEAMSDDIPRAAPMPQGSIYSEQLCNLYVMTDCHVGMLAWRKETGADWDLKIAEDTLTKCFEHMVISSPDAKTCVIAQLGDWLHQDSIESVTPTNRHLLDSDGRFSKVVQASIRILRRLIDFALHRHQKVIVLMAEGNHDISSSIWLRAMFAALYENEPRIHVIDSELPYYTHQHGKTMLAFHHGHMKKNSDLPLLFAAQFPKVWGNTTKRYVHTGHRHHVEEKEHAGMTVVQHPTLAARDAYAARGGWISERQVTSMIYHAEYGHVGRVTVTPEMVR